MKMDNFTAESLGKTIYTEFIGSMINVSNKKNGYDVILDTLLELKGSVWTPLDTATSGFIIRIFFNVIKALLSISSHLGLNLMHLILIVVVLYFGYKKGIKPYNHIQDLDLPSQTEKRRDLINLTRRLRKMGEKILPPYPNGWYCLLESSNVKPGDVKQVDCLGKNFAVFRTLDGNVHVTDAYCPHLGANLAVGGTVKGDCIECPFHKWRFNSVDGKCVSIPNLDAVPKGVSIKVYTCSEIDEAIHVWYDVDDEPPRWTIPSINKIKNGDWVYHARNEFLVQSHIQDIPENGADIAHLNAIHAENLMAGKSMPTSDFWNIFGMHEWNGKWESTEVPHIASVSIKHDVKLFSKISLLSLDVTAKQIGPGYVQLKLTHPIGSVIFLQTVTPIEPFLQKVIHRIYAPWYIRPLANFAMYGETIMFYRDVMIWNSKAFVNNPVLVKTDKCIKAFRSWYQQFYSNNSISFKDSLLGSERDVIEW